MAANEARRDLAEKIRLERLLGAEIRSFNRKLVRQAVREQAQGAGALDAATLQPELTEILEEHYDQVASVFDSQITEILPEDIEAAPEEKAAIAAALAAFFTGRATGQAEIITNTNQRDILASMDQAQVIAQEEAAAGRPQERIGIAMVAGAILSRKLAGRVTGISALETQAAAEAAKATEAQVLTGQAPSVTGGTLRETPVTKEWVTVGDERVRQDHVRADSQEMSLNEPFEVGGQLLRWPGDTSLGATAGNVINCRCASVINQEEVFAERRRRGQAPTTETTATEQLETSFGQPLGAPKPVRITPELEEGEIIAPATVPVTPRKKSPKVIKTVRKAEPSKPIVRTSKSTTATRVQDQKIAAVDKPPELPSQVRLTGDQSAYVEYYKGDGFYKSNEILRNPAAFSAGEVESARKMRDSINRAIKKSEMKTDGVLFRGIKSPELFENAEKLIGKDIPIPTVQSTATNAGSAIGWSGLLRTKTGKFLSANPGQSVVFKIRTRKGQHGLDLESLSIGNTAEREVLLGSGGKYKVTKVRNLTDGSGNVTGKVIEVDYDE